MRHSYIAVVIFILLITLFQSLSYAAELVLSPSLRSVPGLGASYHSESERVVPNYCIDVTDSIRVDNAVQRNLKFDLVKDELTVLNELNFSASGTANFGAGSATAAVTYAQKTQNNDYTLALNWIYEEAGLQEALAFTDFKLSVAGDRAFNQGEKAWIDLCGDEFISTRIYGAQLYFTVRMIFSSKDEARDFAGSLNYTGATGGFGAALMTKLKTHRVQFKLEAWAHQIGGDRGALAAFTGTDKNSDKLVECSSGNVKSCTDMIGQVVKYSSQELRKQVDNQRPAFKLGLQKGGEPQLPNDVIPIVFLTAKYVDHMSPPPFGKYPKWDGTADIARKDIIREIQKQVKLQTTADTLSALPLSEEKITAIKAQSDKIGTNINVLSDRLRECYRNPPECSEMWQKVKADRATAGLAEVDEKVIGLPPKPQAEFRVMTASTGVWSRSESIQAMVQYERELATTNYIEKKKNDQTYTKLALERISKETKGPASVVLCINGDGLKEARLTFDGRDLTLPPSADDTSGLKEHVIPLVKKDGIAPEKFPKTECTVAVVVLSTKKDHGWHDVYLDDLLLFKAARNRGWQYQKEGTFRLRVIDVFQRPFDFDLEYRKWNTVVSQSTPLVTVTYSLRNKFWSQEGDVDFLGDTSWSEDLTNRLRGTRNFAGSIIY